MAFHTKHMNHITTVAIIAVAIVLVIAGIMLTPGAPSETPATGIASLELVNFEENTVEVGDLQKVRWTWDNYVLPTVSVNIIRKVSDNPARYELVRTVSLATINDGSAVWVPAKSDIGANTFVEIGCKLSSQECHASTPSFALAVVDTGRYANTAATYEAIEQLNNK